jgi:hypothetical protein
MSIEPVRDGHGGGRRAGDPICRFEIVEEPEFLADHRLSYRRLNQYLVLLIQYRVPTHVDQIYSMADTSHCRCPASIRLRGKKQSRSQAGSQVSRSHLILFFVIIDQIKMMDDPLEKRKVSRR